MQRVVLNTLLTHALATKFADRVLDLLTFPGASKYVHPWRYAPPQPLASTEMRIYVQAGGKIPTNFTFPTWFVLTNSSTVLDGEFTGTQPLLANAHFCQTANTQYYKHYSFNNSNPLSQREPDSPKFWGYRKKEGFSQAIRINIDIPSSSYEQDAGYVTIFLEGNQRVTISCSNISDPTSHTLELSVLPWARSNTPIYCFANSTATPGSFDFVGMLPPYVAELVFDRTGNFYINGYNYYQLPPITSVDMQLKYNKTSGYFSVTWLDYTRAHYSLTAGHLSRVQYCDTHLTSLACDLNVFKLDDGVYSFIDDTTTDAQTFVALPVYSNHSYVTIRTSYHVGTCYNCPPVSYSIDIDEAINDTLCVNSRQFTVVLNTTQTVTNLHNPTRFSTRFVAGTCPFTLPNINNHLSFGSICFSTTNTGGCTILVQKVWNNYINTFATLYISYQEGEHIYALPKPSSGTTDMSVVTTDTCTTYNIYGKLGTGIIRLSNQTHIPGLYYTSSSGDLLAFKNATTSQIYTVTPCRLSSQVAVYNGSILAAFTATPNTSLPDLQYKTATPTFYYHSIGNESCSSPAITYGSIGICAGGGLTLYQPLSDADVVSPISSGNITIPINFTVSIQTEYIQIEQQPVTVDCRQYVCNGNPRCLTLLNQYTSACSTIEQALSLNARLEASDIQTMLTYSPQALALANISNFEATDTTFNLTDLLPKSLSGKSAIEDILFNKVVTNGLGTVDADYKSCTNGVEIADLFCAQYYNGIMVLPGVADPAKMAAYTASLTGGMILGAATSAVAVPFSLAVQARLNYVALQTNVLQENQQILANSFNQAMGNITLAFQEVSNGLSQVAGAVTTVANALTKIQTVVNEQGQALSSLTSQLSHNFQAISASIADIYNRLNELDADAQVDRLITGRLAALNAFVTQTLSKLAEVRQARQLAKDKINECVKSQSSRYGFCGNGTHLFSIVNAAPQGFVFFHTVLMPTKYTEVTAYSGICHNGRALSLRDPTMALFHNHKYLVSPRNMYEPREPTQADFVYIESCIPTYLNLSSTTIQEVIPDYVDVNQTVSDILERLPNHTLPDLNIDHYNNTILNLTIEIADLNGRAENLTQIINNLESYIEQINSTLVDLEWLNKVETYIKWPWWVWLLIVLAISAFVCVIVTIFLCTGCCGGCFGCCGGCFGLFSKKKRDTDSIPITSFKLKEW
nr:MAG: S protein [Deltacoronavirus sp.]